MHPEMIPPLAWYILVAGVIAAMAIIAFNLDAPGRRRRLRARQARQRESDKAQMWAWDQLKRMSNRQRRLEYHEPPTD